MTTHRTRFVLIPADRDTEEIHDVQDFDTAAVAAGTYYSRTRDGHDLPAASAGDLLYTELLLYGRSIEARWHIAGPDYLLPVTEDQLMEHLGTQLADDAAQYLHAELDPGASH